MSKKNTGKEYSNGEVTIVWQPQLCSHAAKCAKSLGSVFRPKERPWIDATGASTDEIISTINTCPSGALSYFLNESNNEKNMQDQPSKSVDIKMLADGPMLLTGDFIITDSKGNKLEKRAKVALCRCGASENKPFCDGEHNKIGFKG